ncbi:hypothetical protein ACXYTJ_10305 [Gilvimarinus sp. F26214L]|uniref:hypothetical protein n=1 Tax=Gilvimarinus sp. DZF01 TaxID=3461371 RepID=UPI00404543B3
MRGELVSGLFLSHLTAVAFYWGVAKVSCRGEKTLRYLGFGLLMGFSSFFIIVLLSTRFMIGPLLQVLITAGYCAVFINSPLLQRFLTGER